MARHSGKALLAVPLQVLLFRGQRQAVAPVGNDTHEVAQLFAPALHDNLVMDMADDLVAGGVDAYQSGRQEVPGSGLSDVFGEEPAPHLLRPAAGLPERRSEERRVGKEWSTGWWYESLN